MLSPVSGQTDTLRHLSYEKLIEFYTRDTGFERRRLYTRAIIRKSKTDKDTTWLFSGYQIMAKLHSDINTLKYCDSIILLANNPDDKHYPATAYLMKGIYYYNKRDFQKVCNRAAKSLFDPKDQLQYRDSERQDRGKQGGIEDT